MKKGANAPPERPDKTRQDITEQGKTRQDIEDIRFRFGGGVSGIRLDLSVDSRVWCSAFVYCSKSKRKDEIGRSERLEWKFVKGVRFPFQTR